MLRTGEHKRTKWKWPYQIFNSAFKDAHIVNFQQYWSHKHNYTSAWHIDECRGSRVETLHVLLPGNGSEKDIIVRPIWWGDSRDLLCDRTHPTKSHTQHVLVNKLKDYVDLNHVITTWQKYIVKFKRNENNEAF